MRVLLVLVLLVLPSLVAADIERATAAVERGDFHAAFQ